MDKPLHTSQTSFSPISFPKGWDLNMFHNRFKTFLVKRWHLGYGVNSHFPYTQWTLLFLFFLIQLKTSFFNSMWLESLIKKILLTKWTLQSDYNVHHRKWLTSGSSNMKLLQWPFFSNTDVALLEPDDVSNQWLVWFGLSYCFPGNHQSGVSLLKDHTPSTRKRSLENLSINCPNFLRVTTYLDGGVCLASI